MCTGARELGKRQRLRMPKQTAHWVPGAPGENRSHDPWNHDQESGTQPSEPPRSPGCLPLLNGQIWGTKKLVKISVLVNSVPMIIMFLGFRFGPFSEAQKSCTPPCPAVGRCRKGHKQPGAMWWPSGLLGLGLGQKGATQPFHWWHIGAPRSQVYHCVEGQGQRFWEELVPKAAPAATAGRRWFPWTAGRSPLILLWPNGHILIKLRGGY